MACDKAMLMMSNDAVLVGGPTMDDTFRNGIVVEHLCGVQRQALSTGIKPQQEPYRLRCKSSALSEKVGARLLLDPWRRILRQDAAAYLN